MLSSLYLEILEVYREIRLIEAIFLLTVQKIYPAICHYYPNPPIEVR